MHDKLLYRTALTVSRREMRTTLVLLQTSLLGKCRRPIHVCPSRLGLRWQLEPIVGHSLVHCVTHLAEQRRPLVFFVQTEARMTPLGS